MALTVSNPALTYDVGGVLLDRPFKIRRLGHFGFNVDHVDEAFHFYTDLLGFMVSDESSIRPGASAGVPDVRAARLTELRGPACARRLHEVRLLNDRSWPR
jgi:hypothetical protein